MDMAEWNKDRESCDPTDTRRSSTSRVESEKLATGHMNVECWASCAKSATSKRNRIDGRLPKRIATWNVQGLLQTGKFEIVSDELQRCDIEIAGISETHWRGKGHFQKSLYTVYFAGPEEHSKHGVAIILSNKVNKCVLGYNPVSERIISIKLKATPVNINLVQIYAPTLNASEEEREEFYNSLEDVLNKIPCREVTIIMGDFNARIGDTTSDDHLRKVVGNYGVGQRNENGERLIQFCVDNDFLIANTIFKHHIRRLYTWTSPDRQTKNQIDFILIRTRWRSSILNTKTLPGAVCGSDHKLLVSTFRIKLKASRQISNSRKLPQITDRASLCSELEDNIENIITKPVDDQWNIMRDIVVTAIERTQPMSINNTRQPWLSEHSLSLINERRRMANQGLNTPEDISIYKRLSTEIQSNCRRDKNQYYNDMCTEIQRHANSLNTREVFQKIKFITRQFKAKTWAITDEHNVLLTEFDKVLERWQRYCTELYTDNVDIYAIPDEHLEEPDILIGEVKCAVRRLADNKAPGVDRITAEIIKALPESYIKIIHDICTHIWKTGKWPTDWTTSIITPLHKKGSTTNCDNFRLLALVSHISKIMLYIIHSRLQPFVSYQLSPEQAGFVTGRGTREQILNLRQIIEKAREYYIPLYLCFIDYSKAFDNVKWSKLWCIMLDMGVPLHLVNVIKNLYESSTAMVKIDNNYSTRCPIKKGVRQGCILSPILFNIYSEFIMRHVLDQWEGGINIGGLRLSNLRYADDTLLLATNQEELLTLIGRLRAKSEEYGLQINNSKTKILIVDRENNNFPNVQQIEGYEVVSSFTYLGALINNTGSCESEIRRRIQMGRTAMTQLTKLWRSRDISRNTKINLVETLVFSIFRYACETWTIRTADRRRIDAFEMWCWRRMLRIPWTARRTNASVINEIKPKQRLSTTVYASILKYFGHITRADNMEKLVVQGKPNGRRRRGRSPSRWMDTIELLLDTNMEQATRQTANRERWRATVRSIATRLDSQP